MWVQCPRFPIIHRQLLTGPDNFQQLKHLILHSILHKRVHIGALKHFIQRWVHIDTNFALNNAVSYYS